MPSVLSSLLALGCLSACAGRHLTDAVRDGDRAAASLF